MFPLVVVGGEVGGVGAEGGVWEGECARIIFSKILNFYGYFLNRIKQAFLGL